MPQKKHRVYLDYASATPVDPKVLKVMRETSATFANPASLFEEGRKAKEILDNARKTVAGVLRASPTEIVFTSGGTEANNLAIFGVVEYFSKINQNKKPHIIVSSIEHSSVLEAIKKIEKNGAEVSLIKPDSNGAVDPKKVRDALKKNTALVSVMYANNEIGTIEPIKEITKVIRRFKKAKSCQLKTKSYPSSFPIFHTDAAQAANYLSLDVFKLGVDLMTLDGSKIYGPKGVGALFVKRNISIIPQIVGGGQENNLRSGTENLSVIAGFAKALVIVEKTKAKESKRLETLRDYFVGKLSKLPKASINGSLGNRLPNNVSVCVENLDAEFAVFQLDQRGIAVSSASTCMNLKEDSYSYVIEEIGKAGCSRSSLRFSLGRGTSKKDIDHCLKALFQILLKEL
ncbi:MAG TPA: cysteine desulfurase family protein [Candidatus Paceibacterota bacterium]